MNEEYLFHGGHKENRTWTRIKRALRPKYHKIGMAAVPFDWVKGVEYNKRIKDQGQSSSCGGQAGSRFIENALNIPEQSAKALYSQGYANGGGMTKDSLQNVICKGLDAAESEVPSSTDENDMRSTSWIKPARFRVMPQFVPVTVSVDKESIATALRDTGGVIMLLAGTNNGTWLTATPKPPVKGDGLERWFHYLVFSGVKASYPKPLRVDQSWGTAIGDSGHQYFGDDYLASSYITDCFTLVHKDIFQDPRISIIQQMLKLYQQVLNILTGAVGKIALLVTKNV